MQRTVPHLTARRVQVGTRQDLMLMKAVIVGLTGFVAFPAQACRVDHPLNDEA
jgi:hypothetical protein